MADAQDEKSVLASSDAGGNGTVELICKQQRQTPAGSFEHITKGDIKKSLDDPTYKMVGNIFFGLIRTSKGTSDKNTLSWVAYDNKDFISDSSQWLSDLHYDRDRKEWTVVLLKVKDFHLHFRLYLVPVANNLGQYPVELDPQHMEKWPKASLPFAETKVQAREQSFSTYNRISLTIKDDMLIMDVMRDDDKASIQAKYSQKTHKWSFSSSSPKVEFNELN